MNFSIFTTSTGPILGSFRLNHVKVLLEMDQTSENLKLGWPNRNFSHLMNFLKNIVPLFGMIEDRFHEKFARYG